MYTVVKIPTLSNGKIPTLQQSQGVQTFQIDTWICRITIAKWNIEQIIQILSTRSNVNSYGQALWKLRFRSWFGMPSCPLICVLIKVKYLGLKNEEFSCFDCYSTTDNLEKTQSVNPQGSFSPGSAWCKLDALIWVWKNLWQSG